MDSAEGYVPQDYLGVGEGYYLRRIEEKSGNSAVFGETAKIRAEAEGKKDKAGD